MNSYPDSFRTEEQLEEVLSRPYPDLITTMADLSGDLIFLGVSGKMGISMAGMAKRASEAAKTNCRIIGVSRFSNRQNRLYLEEQS